MRQGHIARAGSQRQSQVRQKLHPLIHHGSEKYLLSAG
jgi:hypothetical protein